MSIKLRFMLGPEISSQAIAWFSQGHYSHVDAVMPDGSLLGARSDTVGGQPPGVRIRPVGYTQASAAAVMTVPCSDQQMKDFYNYLLKQLGKPYDHTAIWAFVANRDWREDDSWICSELQAAAGEQCGVLPKLVLAPNKITPVACALVYSSIPGVTLG